MEQAGEQRVKIRAGDSPLSPLLPVPCSALLCPGRPASRDLVNWAGFLWLCLGLANRRHQWEIQDQEEGEAGVSVPCSLFALSDLQRWLFSCHNPSPSPPVTLLPLLALQT